MNKMIVRFGVTLSLAALVASSAIAGQSKPKPSGPTCPVCHMALSAKKTKDNTVAVKIGKKTYYCCSKCSMKH